MRDQNLLFDNALALTSSQVSTNIVPLGPLAAGNARRNIGEANNQLYVVLTVGTAMLSSGSATLTGVLQTDNNSGFSSATTIFTPFSAIPKASLVANAKFVAPLPPGAYENFLQMSWTAGTADFSAGTLYCEVTMNPQSDFYAYDSALSNG